MAYIVYFYKDEEVGRIPLKEESVLVGRSPECAVAIRDVLLSRRHARIEPAEGGWRILDLESKNGTRIAGTPVMRQALQDGDVIRMGRSTLRFFVGEFVPGAAPKPSSSSVARPADPFEALSGTVSAFEYQPRGPARSTDRLPTPRPGPLEPASYGEENVRGLVTELVSSSWDSIYEDARRKREDAPRPDPVETVRRRRAREPHVDLALQVGPEHSERDHDAKMSPEVSEPLPGVLAPPPPPPGRIRRLFRKLGFLFQLVSLLMLIRPGA